MWTRSEFRDIVRPPVIGMVHLRPLPGAPRWAGCLDDVRRAALADAAALATGGVGAVMIENYHDVPFHPGAVPAETIAAMTAVITAIRNDQPALKLGVNVLRNDAAAALAIAVAVGADFVRVNVHTGAAITDQGTIEGAAASTLRLRRNLGAEHVGILADVRVKHARPLVERPLAEEARDLRLRGLADAIIVTGAATGSSTAAADVAEVRAALPDCPVVVGSGVDTGNVTDYLPDADGFIVGSSLQEAEAGSGFRNISAVRTAAFLNALRSQSAKG